MFGLPVIFGPNYKKFKEAVELIAEGGAFTINSQTSLNDSLHKLTGNETNRRKAAEISKDYVAKNVGSTGVIIKKVFNKPSHSLTRKFEQYTIFYRLIHTRLSCTIRFFVASFPTLGRPAISCGFSTR